MNTNNTTNRTPATYAEAIAQGYKDGAQQWQRGYISRRQNSTAAPVHVAGGKRRGQLYVLLPSHKSTNYCVRQYLIK